MKAMKNNDRSNLRKPLNRKIKNHKSDNTKDNVANFDPEQDELLENGAFLDKTELLKAARKAQKIDHERVEKIKRAIEKGEYKADIMHTAEKLLQLEDEIWGKNDKP